MEATQERVIQINRIARMDAGLFLSGVEFVHLKRRQDKTLVAPSNRTSVQKIRRASNSPEPTLSFASATKRPVGARKP